MEENKTIKTVSPEKIDDDDLEQAAGGCTFSCDFEQIRYWTAYENGIERTFKVLRCKNCGRKKFLRSTLADGEPDTRDREISRDEYMYYHNDFHLGSLE
ncbi:MAG: hypothetical protein IKD68_10325 [Solobacterium sp.]|nr:hypothetical protein [Solobacterium sp.]